MLHVFHAIWSAGRLHVWGEDASRMTAGQGRAPGLPQGSESSEASGAPAGASGGASLAAPGGILAHSFALDVAALLARLSPADAATREAVRASSPGELRVKLPTLSEGSVDPLPSPHLARAINSHETGTLLRTFTVPTLVVMPEHVAAVLDALGEETRPAAGRGEGSRSGGVTQLVGSSVLFYSAVLRLARSLLAQQRFVPMLSQETPGELRGLWQPWVSDEKTAERVSALVRSMPGIARAAEDAAEHQAWPIIEDFLTRVVDAECRRALIREDFEDSVRERDGSTDLHVTWLKGLLGENRGISAAPARSQELARRVRQWISGLEDRGASSAWRLLLKLREPDELQLAGPSAEPDETDPAWTLSFHLQSVDRPTLIVDAEDVWPLTGDSMTIEGKRIDSPQELLLGELGRASRLYPKLEGALEESEPTTLGLTTRQAYQFLREFAPILQEQGFGVAQPDWWESPLARLGARLRLESESPEVMFAQAGAIHSPAATPSLGLGALVRYRWEISLGDTTLSLAEFEKLAARRSPLVKVNGRWVEIRPEDVQSAIKFVRENPGGDMKVGDALRMAFASDAKAIGIPVIGLEATGWVRALMDAEAAQQALAIIQPPEKFHGTLRPYQIRGVSWMAFLERVGLGLCLADDMGLGKTIQLLALMAYEREQMNLHLAANPGSDQKVNPTLLVVPMSVVGNWIHETRRFCPELKVLVHHGGDRLAGDVLLKSAGECDLAITTYSLAHRDRETLAKIAWGRIVLDEAQYIKNPQAKQSQAVRQINAERRVALTGTPVENRLSELWSIMDFLNPGYLGSAGNFRQRFAVPVERYRDKQKAEQLKGLVKPFILRRLKTDPTVVADLPAKVESREYIPLTSEQATLYEQCVRRMLAEVERSEGIQRRGMVLSALIKLKQICNHPSQLLKDHDPSSGTPISPTRSGKTIRVLELLEEILAEGDSAIIFSQFRQMGALLEGMLKHHLDRDILFLHGGTTQRQRQDIVENFQKADGRYPILLVSLKAGGVGLNLTAANHVIHFDRWWNPAVENQATDRAFRIGQTRTVQVHKFVVRGTLEERIDQMIEQKTELAENIIGSGERWLTELDSSQLRELLTLRNDAIADEV